MMLSTPNTSHIGRDLELKGRVYSPSDDTFLFLDALQQDRGLLRDLSPALVLEIGPGSGAIGVFTLQLCNPDVAPCLIAIDINYHACIATKKTALKNGVAAHVDVVFGSLFSSLRRGQFADVILFNPPYVPSTSEEVVWYTEGNIDAAWAGGKYGREVIEAFISQVAPILSTKGYVYLLLEARNEIDNIRKKLKMIAGLNSEVILERKNGYEKLVILRCQHLQTFFSSTPLLALPPARFYPDKFINVNGYRVECEIVESIVRSAELKQDGDTGTTSVHLLHCQSGSTLWDSAIALGKYLNIEWSYLGRPSCVLELGAGGFAVPSLCAAALGACCVFATDLPYCIPHLEKTISRHRDMWSIAESVKPIVIDWCSPTESSDTVDLYRDVELILGADIVWLDKLVHPLVQTLSAIRDERIRYKKPFKMLMMHTTRSTSVDKRLMELLHSEGFSVEILSLNCLDEQVTPNQKLLSIMAPLYHEFVLMSVMQINHQRRRPLRNSVWLRVYDISNGSAALWSQLVLGQKIDGIWHTGINIFGLEYFYGGGIECNTSAEVEASCDMQIVEMQLLGYSSKTQSEFESFLIDIWDKFTPETYDLVLWNCNHFADTCSRFLLNNRGIPEYILDLPSTVRSSFFGDLILKFFKRFRQGRNRVTPFSPHNPDHPRHEFNAYTDESRKEPSSQTSSPDLLRRSSLTVQYSSDSECSSMPSRHRTRRSTFSRPPRTSREMPLTRLPISLCQQAASAAQVRRERGPCPAGKNAAAIDDTTNSPTQKCHAYHRVVPPISYSIGTKGGNILGMPKLGIPSRYLDSSTVHDSYDGKDVSANTIPAQFSCGSLIPSSMRNTTAASAISLPPNEVRSRVSSMDSNGCGNTPILNVSEPLIRSFMARSTSRFTPQNHAGGICSKRDLHVQTFKKERIQSETIVDTSQKAFRHPVFRRSASPVIVEAGFQKSSKLAISSRRDNPVYPLRLGLQEFTGETLHQMQQNFHPSSQPKEYRYSRCDVRKNVRHNVLEPTAASDQFPTQC